MATGCSSAEISEKLLSVSTPDSPIYSCVNVLCPVFRQAKRSHKAMLAHEKALEWREVFELALQESITDEELKATGYRLAGVYYRHVDHTEISD